MRVKVFFSYSFIDKDIVSLFYSFLSRYTNLNIFFFDKAMHGESWEEEVFDAIESCDYFVFFMGGFYGDTQKNELRYYGEKRRNGFGKYIKIELPGVEKKLYRNVLPGELGTISVSLDGNNRGDYNGAIKELVENYLGIRLVFGDDLPINPHLFDYEKTIIDFFMRKSKIYSKGLDEVSRTSEEKINELFDGIDLSKNEVCERLDLDLDEYDNIDVNQKRGLLKLITDEIHVKIKEGCTPAWPTVELKKGATHDNELNDVGEFRAEEACVVAAALSSYHKCPDEFCIKVNNFVFPEAGPREKLYYPKYTEGAEGVFRVAILVSGGIAPGINAVIDGITQRHYKYRSNRERLEIWGLRKGFQAFQNLDANKIYLLNKEESGQEDKKPQLVTSGHINEGGSIIGTSREESLLDDSERIENLRSIVSQLKANHIRILYIIGGDGSMKAAHAISNISKNVENNENNSWDLSVVAIPKTMDNDILWVWQTFGFLSAVEKAREFIDSLAFEIKSNPRLGIVQLFGSDSGFVVSHAVLASRTGICDIALIPEVPFSIKELGETLKNKFSRKGGEYGLIVMAETAIPTDAMDYVDYPNKLPEYFDASFYDNLIDSLNDDKRKEIINKCYTKEKDDKYTLKSNLLHGEEEGARKVLWESEKIKYFNFDKKKKGKNVSVLNSLGCFHYIDIDLTRKEKLAIIEYVKKRNKNQRIQGQTNDELRTAGLKIVTNGIEQLPIKWGKNFRVLNNEPRHLLRAISPSTIDIIFGNRLGTLAVDNAMAGYTDFMISQWLTEFVLVPLKLVVLGRKRIPKNGVFWKSVLAKTGQPNKMC